MYWISLSEWMGVEREEEVARLKRHVWARLWASVHPPILNFTLWAIGSCRVRSDTVNVAEATEPRVSKAGRSLGKLLNPQLDE